MYIALDILDSLRMVQWPLWMFNSGWQIELLLLNKLNNIFINHMKTQADKKCTEGTFQVGEQVFLKLRPCVEASAVHRAHH